MIGCTILIPTYNRPEYLKRILSYYSDYESTYYIIVADSSSTEVKKLNEESISSFSNLNVQHLDNYSPKINTFHKVAGAVNYVDTKYCVLCADDDFVTPNGINQAVDFLENNPDFIVAHGRYIRFWPRSGVGNKQQFVWKPNYRFQSITSPDPKKRLTYHLSHYFMPTFYAVHRTDFLKLISDEVTKFTDDYRFGELLPSMLALIYGKLKCLDVLYAARETILTSASATSATLSDFIRDGTYEEKYKRFRQCLSTHLSQQSQLDIEESKKVIDNAMSAFIMKKVNLNANGGNIITRKLRGLLDFLNLPDWLDKGLRRSYTELTRSRRSEKYSIDMSPSSKYYDDFNKIRLHVLSYSK